MSTATLTAPTTTTYDKTPREAHEENALFAKQNNLPMVEIPGNTFPIKNVLYAMGGKWNKDKKVQEVPQHRAEEALALAAKFAPKPKVAKPAATVAAPVKAKVEKAPKADKPAHNSEANLILRTQTVLDMIGKLDADVGLVMGDDELLKKAQVDLIVGRMAIADALKGLKGE